MESCEVNYECFWENKKLVLWSQLFQNIELFLECVICALPPKCSRNKVGYYMTFQATSFIGSVLPDSTTSGAVTADSFTMTYRQIYMELTRAEDVHKAVQLGSWPTEAAIAHCFYRRSEQHLCPVSPSLMWSCAKRTGFQENKNSL